MLKVGKNRYESLHCCLSEMVIPKHSLKPPLNVHEETYPNPMTSTTILILNYPL